MPHVLPQLAGARFAARLRSSPTPCSRYALRATGEDPGNVETGLSAWAERNGGCPRFARQSVGQQIAYA